MMPRQLPLFPDGASPSFQNRDRVSTTFHGKLQEPVHRWFRLTPSFSPQLARDVLERLGTRPSDRVLEPYSGTGTVPLEARRRGNCATGVELNPGLCLVSRVKTARYDPALAGLDLASFEAAWSQATREIRDPAEYLAAHPAAVPAIASPARWWAPRTLAQLAAARCVLAGAYIYHYPDLVRFAAAAVAIEVSAVEHGHPSLSFAAGPAPERDALAAYRTKSQQMLADIASESATGSSAGAEVTVLLGNTKELTRVLGPEAQFDVLVTSPPYPNRFSYARETRPLLYFLDLVQSASEVGDLEVAAMGGTWGKATWLLQKPVVCANIVLERLLGPFQEKMGASNPILKHYVVRYFNDLWCHAEQISRAMAPRASMGWVVGNAIIAGNEVATDRILRAIFEELGWRCDGVQTMRCRHSKRGLCESVVFLSRG